MSLRVIISFIIFVLLTVYFTFLNPGNLEIHLTQNQTFQIPLVVFLLAAILTGVLLTSIFTGFTQIKKSFRDFMRSRTRKIRSRRMKQNEKLFQKAESALEGGHPKKGILLLKKILNDNPNHIPSLLQLGNVYRKNGEIDQAVAMHQKAVQQDRDNPKALQFLAEDYTAAGQTDKALEMLKKARHLEPESLSILRKLREAYRDKRDWNQVLQTQKSILSNVQNRQEYDREKAYSSQIAYLRGCELMDQQLMEPAVSELKRAIKEYPKSLPPYILLGDVYQKNGNLKAAIKIWKSGYENTGSSVCLLRLRAVYEQSQQPQEVIRLYQEAIRETKNSEKEALSLVLAGIYIDQGQMENAMNTLWDIATPSIPAHLLLIKAHQERNESEKADQVIRAALKKVTHSLSKFVCKTCHREFDQWSGICPECKTWGSLETVNHHSL